MLNFSIYFTINIRCASISSSFHFPLYYKVSNIYIETYIHVFNSYIYLYKLIYYDSTNSILPLQRCSLIPLSVYY